MWDEDGNLPVSDYSPASITYTCDPTVIYYLEPTSGSCTQGALWTSVLRGTRNTWQGTCNHGIWGITCSPPSGSIISPCDINTPCAATSLSAGNANVLIKQCMDCLTGNLGIGTFVSQCRTGTSDSQGCYDLRWVQVVLFVIHVLYRVHIGFCRRVKKSEGDLQQTTIREVLINSQSVHYPTEGCSGIMCGSHYSI